MKLKQTDKKTYLENLERINYFEYNDKREIEGFTKVIINSFFKPLVEENIQLLINPFTFKFDNRIYLIDFVVEKFILDKIGIQNKYGMEINENAELNDFFKFIAKLGLNVLISKLKYVDKDENEFKIDLEVNKRNYNLCQNYEHEKYDYYIIYQFVNILNNELTKIKSKERIYFINNYPFTIIFLNLEIYNYLKELEPKELRPVEPQEWEYIN
ncbi:hypothetical protein [Flavobacterium geliluteum]|uniref:Uncharacterized protein n=1 Tax=Flavobacterium geliluteum TaxID=2816120 RepID=A0A941AY25_9FLAO|nr:hypothetical protein [Flavobacterium geliluteum]MBP4139855.1 hypothetical protein [Flavobacterium geliluteum]